MPEHTPATRGAQRPEGEPARNGRRCGAAQATPVQPGTGVGTGSRSVTELTVLVVTPAVSGAPRYHPAGIQAPFGERGKAVPAPDGLRCVVRTDIARTNAELAPAVVSPTVSVPVRSDAARVAATGGNHRELQPSRNEDWPCVAANSVVALLHGRSPSNAPAIQVALNCYPAGVVIPRAHGGERVSPHNCRRQRAGLLPVTGS